MKEKADADEAAEGRGGQTKTAEEEAGRGGDQRAARADADHGAATVDRLRGRNRKRKWTRSRAPSSGRSAASAGSAV